MQIRRITPAAKVLAALVFAGIAVAYPVWRSFVAPMPEVDFRYYWLAGQMWEHGLDPYSARFSSLGKHVLPPGSSWLYPPSWWPICLALAAFDFSMALNAWRATVPVILMATTIPMVALLSRGHSLADRLLLIAASCAIAVAMEPTAIVLVGGQVSPSLIYAGLVLITCATITDRSGPLVAGLILVALKPQVGVVVFLAFLFAPAHRRAVAVAILILLALSVPQFVQFGTRTTIVEILGNIQSWSRLSGNTPLGTTGPVHLLARMGLTAPPAASYLLAAASACAAGTMFRRDHLSLAALALLIAGVAAFVPLHNYDMAFLLVLAAILIAVDTSLTSRLIVGIAILFCIRPMRIEALFAVPIHSDVSGGILTYSVASLVLLAIAAQAALTEPGRPERESAATAPASVPR